MSKTYNVEVTRDGKWWMVSVPELDLLTQARRLSEVSLMAREVIAVSSNIPLENVSVDVHFDDISGVHAGERLGLIESERNQLKALNVEVAVHTSALAGDLVKAGVPLRDVGELLGVSYQRVHQIVNA